MRILHPLFLAVSISLAAARDLGVVSRDQLRPELVKGLKGPDQSLA